MALSKEAEAFLEHCTVIKALSKNSLEAYNNDLLEFENFLGSSAIGADTPKILEFLRLFNNRYTINRKLSTINSFFSFCYQNGWVDERVKVKSSKAHRELPKFLGYDEIQKALKDIGTDSEILVRDRAFILFLYATGCRVSEALAANFSDIEDGWLRIRSAKGDKERVVPVASSAVDWLKRYKEVRKKRSDTIWLNYKGERLSRISAFKITKKYLGVSPHVLRHSFATSLILGGADVIVVQELLGHSSVSTTQIYTHIQKQNLMDTLVSYHPLGKEVKI